MRGTLLSLLTLASTVSAWLPAERDLFTSPANNLAMGKGRSMKRWNTSNKIRGVNLGSLFIIEPWMANTAWGNMGCGGQKSEFDCMIKLGQEKGDAAFKKHWETWITEEDLDKMIEFGINTIRVPVGYWLVEELVDKTEHFPRGGLAYLDKLAENAAKRNIYVILDLHGAPFSQEIHQPFTGQFSEYAGFYTTAQYERAYKFLQTMTARIHNNQAYRTTGMLEVLNEPQRTHASLLPEYYVTAYNKIRETEASLNIPDDKKLTVQFMAKSWGAGDPAQHLQGKTGVAYDDHRYLKWAPIEQTQASYISTSCGEKYGADHIVGEWSLAAGDKVEGTPEWDPSTHKDWYKQWWSAQVLAYESGMGWVFWSWKAELGDDYRWSYRTAAEKKVVPHPDEAPKWAKCPGN